MKKDSGFTWKLGLFVTIGFFLLIITIYIIGKQRNLFGSTFHLTTTFRSVSGLKIGNLVRFSGINVGTIDDISLLSDTSVRVNMVIKKDVQKFIKKDATASIGSDGLMGDKLLTINPGTPTNKTAEENDLIASLAPVEMEQVMTSIKATADNAKIISDQLSQFAYKMNNGNGALSKLIGDEGLSNSIKNTMSNLDKSSSEFANFTSKMNNGKGALSKLVSDEGFSKKLDSTMSNIQSSTKGLNENMEAAKHNFLLRGFFKKKKKAEDKKQKELEKQNEQNKQKDTTNKS